MRTKTFVASIYFPCDFSEHAEGDEVILNVEYPEGDDLDPDEYLVQVTFGPRPTGALFTC